MRRVQICWDDETAEHLARHGVAPEEAEEICGLRPYILRTRQGRYLVLGYTGAGRYLTVILESLGGGRMKIITARAMTPPERRRYLER